MKACEQCSFNTISKKNSQKYIGNILYALWNWICIGILKNALWDAFPLTHYLPIIRLITIATDIVSIIPPDFAQRYEMSYNA